MASIMVNGKKLMKGKFTVHRSLDITQEPPKITIMGQLATHRYIEEINEIKSDRYEVKGVTVLEEIFGSDDFSIVYAFVAEEINIIGGESPLDRDKIKEKENIEYGDDADGK